MFKLISHHSRQYFLAGLLTLIPLIATIWILKTIVVWAEDFFLGLMPARFHPANIFGVTFPGIGLLATLLTVLLVGIITRTYLAKRIIGLGEGILARVPIARGVYPGIKRLMQLVVGDATAKPTRVVIIPYPHENSRAYAFVTGELTLPDATGEPEKYLRVFIPTTPNPTSGFLLMIPETATFPADVTVEQASKIIVSGGLV